MKITFRGVEGMKRQIIERFPGIEWLADSRFSVC